MAELTKLSALGLLAHGDFSATLAHVCPSSCGAVAHLPHRRIFFLSDPALVAEAALNSAAALRDRQDADASGPGIVSACGKEWSRRREPLRVLQTRAGLEALAAPAVADALVSCGCPAHTLLLPPRELQEWCGRVVRHSLRQIAIATPAPASDSRASAEASRDPCSSPPPAAAPARAGLAAVLVLILAPVRAALARLVDATLRAAARFSLLVDHSRALLWPTDFFTIAELFTNRPAKTARRATQWRMALARMRPSRQRAARVDPYAQLSWIQEQVQARQLTSASSSSSVSASVSASASASAGAASVSSGGSPPRDLLEALLAPATGLSTGEVVDVLSDVLAAGAGTTAATLSTASALLQAHPAAARRVAAEAHSAFGIGRGDVSGGTSEESTSTRVLSAALAQALTRQTALLAYTRAVLLEATRLYPAAPLLLRVARRDAHLGGLPIPRGSGVVASTAQLGRSPGAWERADEFLPERFLPAHPLYRSADAAKAYMSFGAGPRACVGQQLALAVASLVLARMALQASAAGLLDEFPDGDDAEPGDCDLAWPAPDE